MFVSKQAFKKHCYGLKTYLEVLMALFFVLKNIVVWCECIPRKVKKHVHNLIFFSIHTEDSMRTHYKY